MGGLNESIEPRRTKHIASAYLAQPEARSHAVQFYEDEAFLIEAVGDFVAAGLRAGDQVLTLMTGAHLHALAARLTGLGVDVRAATERGQLTTVDAHALLPLFMRDGMPDVQQCRDECERLLLRVKEHRQTPSSGIRVHGEMVDVLARAGNLRAASLLEELWNEVCANSDVALLCTYDMAAFTQSEDAQPFDRVCSLHTHVLPTESFANVPDLTVRMREVARLQQRARALEASAAFRDGLLAVDHDLRNPLSSILTTTRLMRLRGDMGPVTEQRLDRVIESAERMQRMIDKLLEATRARLASKEPVPSRSSDCCVLIVDDQEDVRDSLREAVEMVGRSVLTAANGVEALELLALHRPCLIVLDLIMPVMSGQEVWDELQKRPELSDISVVVSTSAPHLAPPGAPVLPKPTELEALWGWVQRACRCSTGASFVAGRGAKLG